MPFGDEPGAVGRANVDQVVELADVEVLVPDDALVQHVDPAKQIQILFRSYRMSGDPNLGDMKCIISVISWVHLDQWGDAIGVWGGGGGRRSKKVRNLCRR